jgi:hypothetical protein
MQRRARQSSWCSRGAHSATAISRAPLQTHRQGRLPENIGTGTPLEQALLACSLDMPHDDTEPLHRPVRLSLFRPVRCRPLEDHDSSVGALNNLSIGGVFIRSALRTRPGALMAVGFHLPLPGVQAPLCTMGQVAWVSADNAGFGLSFLDPPDEMLCHIREMIQRHSSEGWHHLALFHQSKHDGE